MLEALPRASALLRQKQILPKPGVVGGLTVWPGNAAVLGIGIAWHPEAAASVDQLPPWLNRVAALTIIVALVAYVVWVWTQPRSVGRGPWSVILPGGPLTLLQICIGIVD